MSDLNVYQKLAEIRKKDDVAYIQKDAKVQGYKALTHDQLTSIVRPYFDEYGIIIVPRQTHGELQDAGKSTSSGNPFTHYIGMYEIDFVNIDQPEDKTTVVIGAIGEDTNDKGPGKAHSYATKYAILKILSIETGDSEESRQESRPDYITTDQQTLINDKIKSSGADQLKFLKFLKCKSVNKITADKYSIAIKALEEKEKDNANS